MATTLPDATEHAAVEEEGGVGIITRKKSRKGGRHRYKKQPVLLQYFRKGDGEFPAKFLERIFLGTTRNTTNWK